MLTWFLDMPLSLSTVSLQSDKDLNYSSRKGNAWFTCHGAWVWQTPYLGITGTNKPGYSKKAIKIQSYPGYHDLLHFNQATVTILHCPSRAPQWLGRQYTGFMKCKCHPTSGPNQWGTLSTLDLNRNTAIFLCDASTDRQRSWKRIMFTAKTDKDLFLCYYFTTVSVKITLIQFVFCRAHFWERRYQPEWARKSTEYDEGFATLKTHQPDVRKELNWRRRSTKGSVQKTKSIRKARTVDSRKSVIWLTIDVSWYGEPL